MWTTANHCNKKLAWFICNTSSSSSTAVTTSSNLKYLSSPCVAEFPVAEDSLNSSSHFPFSPYIVLHGTYGVLKILYLARGWRRDMYESTQRRPANMPSSTEVLQTVLNVHDHGQVVVIVVLWLCVLLSMYDSAAIILAATSQLTTVTIDKRGFGRVISLSVAFHWCRLYRFWAYSRCLRSYWPYFPRSEITTDCCFASSCGHNWPLHGWYDCSKYTGFAAANRALCWLVLTDNDGCLSYTVLRETCHDVSHDYSKDLSGWSVFQTHTKKLHRNH